MFFFSSDPAVSSPIFFGDKRESLMQKVPDPRYSGEVWVNQGGGEKKLHQQPLAVGAIFFHRPLTGWSQSVLAGSDRRTLT